jgi:hypothetical protein
MSYNISRPASVLVLNLLYSLMKARDVTSTPVQLKILIKVLFQIKSISKVRDYKLEDLQELNIEV